MFRVQVWNLWVFSGIPSLWCLMVDCLQNGPQVFLSLYPYPFVAHVTLQPCPSRGRISLSSPWIWAGLVACFAQLNAWKRCCVISQSKTQASLQASTCSLGNLPSQGEKPGLSLLEDERPYEPEMGQPSFPSWSPEIWGRGRGREGIFVYLLLIHIFSQFFYFWPECTPSFRSTWGPKSLSLAESLQDEHYCFWASPTPGWGFRSLKSACLTLVHTFPAFKMLLLCVFSCSLCPWFYCLLLPYCKV